MRMSLQGGAGSSIGHAGAGIPKEEEWAAGPTIMSKTMSRQPGDIIRWAEEGLNRITRTLSQ